MKVVDVYSAAAGSACVTRQVVPDKAVTRSVLARLRRVAGVALLACAGSTLASGAAAAANKVRIGVIGALSDASFYIADAKGYFKDEGVDVEIIEFQNSAQVIAPMGNGQLDVAAGAASAGLYNAIARGIDIRIVADKASNFPGNGYVPLLVRKDLIDSGAFKSLKDLKGLRIGSMTPGGSALSLLNEALKKGGVAFKDVEVVFMGHAQLAAALKNKALDAAHVTEPNATRVVQSGTVVRFIESDELYPQQQVAIVLYSGDFAKKDPVTAQKVMRAYIRATRDYNDALKDGVLKGKNSDDIIAILSRATTEKDVKIYKVAISHFANPNGRVNIASLKQDYKFFKERNLITRDIDLDKVVDHSFVDAVVKELGPYTPKK